MNSGNYSESLKFLELAKELINIREGDRLSLRVIYNLGLVHKKRSNPDYPQAQKFLMQALKISENNTDAMYQKHLIYNELGAIHFLERKYAEAIDLYKISLDNAVTAGEKARALANIGESYSFMKDLKAKEYIKQSIDLIPQIDDESIIVSIYNIAATDAYKQGQFEETVEYLNNALAYSKKGIKSAQIEETLYLAIEFFREISKRSSIITAQKYESILDLLAKQNYLREKIAKENSYKASQSTVRLSENLNSMIELNRKGREANQTLLNTTYVLIILMLIAGAMIAYYYLKEANKAEKLNRIRRVLEDV